MPSGKVKWFDVKKGYGFIELDDGSGHVFVHYTDIATEGFKSLKEGDRVKFEISKTEKGKKAVNVVKIES